jgi:aerobic-type carbon monoxide dehydrogenase small subunit (CoxS/CutS family)
MRKEAANFVVNGITYELLIDSNTTLLELLRGKLGLTGPSRDAPEAVIAEPVPSW